MASALLVITSLAACHTAGAAPVEVDRRAQLFIDDGIIERTRRLVKRMHEPVKYEGNPVLVADRRWEGRTVCFGSTLFRPEQGLFEKWYLAHDIWGSRNDKRPLEESSCICYARSADGVHWEKPELGEVEWRGSKDNNIVLRHQGSHFDSMSVVERPGAQPRYTLIVFQGTWPYEAKKIAEMGLEYLWPQAHYAFHSEDGLGWASDYENPVFYLRDPPPGRYRAMDRTCFGYDLARGMWLGFLKWSHEGKRARRHSESADFKQWTQPELVLHADEDDPPDMQFYGHYGFRYGCTYVGLLEAYRTGPETIELQLISSRDGQHWERAAGRHTFLRTGPPGSWDSEMVLLESAAPCRVGDELWFFYAGYNTKHNVPEQGGAQGLAKLRLDGFVSVSAGEEEGRLTTAPLALTSQRLSVNAEVRGSLRAELRDMQGNVLPGFSRLKCTDVHGDSVRHEVFWQNRPALPRGVPVKLVFYLRDADLYSFRCP